DCDTGARAFPRAGPAWKGTRDRAVVHRQHRDGGGPPRPPRPLPGTARFPAATPRFAEMRHVFPVDRRSDPVLLVSESGRPLRAADDRAVRTNQLQEIESVAGCEAASRVVILRRIGRNRDVGGAAAGGDGVDGAYDLLSSSLKLFLKLLRQSARSLRLQVFERAARDPLHQQFGDAYCRDDGEGEDEEEARTKGHGRTPRRPCQLSSSARNTSRPRNRAR